MSVTQHETRAWASDDGKVGMAEFTVDGRTITVRGGLEEWARMVGVMLNNYNVMRQKQGLPIAAMDLPERAKQ